MKAHLSTTKSGDALVAQFETGERIEDSDPLKLAEQLRLAGVTADELTVTRWTDNLEQAPATGHVIVIKAVLHKGASLEN